MTSPHFKELLQLFDIALFFKAPDQPEFFCSASETARLAAPHTKNRQEVPVATNVNIKNQIEQNSLLKTLFM